MWALSELIEAATRTENVDLAERALMRLGEHTQGTDSDWALGLHARGRAALSERDAAERFYREAIGHLGRTRLQPELARAHLVYGEWLRRENRRIDARAQLREAHELFLAIGMEAFAERARGELLATGEDRKSTRLNSSHANISYAAFCLKTTILYRQILTSSTPRTTAR